MFGLVFWELRGTLLAIAIVVGVLLPVPDATQSEYAAAVLSVLGIGASVFIAFRNTTGYNRWWEARTLWGAIIIGSRTTHNSLTSVDNGSPATAEILDRMRRRQVRYCWQLASELRRIPTPADATDLTPEDPDDSDATELLRRQAVDVSVLAAGGHIDEQARLLLMNANTATGRPRAAWSGFATSRCRSTTTCSSACWPGSSGSWRSVGSTAPPIIPAAWRWESC